VVADNEYPEDGTGSSSSRPTAGEILRAAREARELSVERLARALNLDLPAVEAIETDRYAVIGAPVFVRGHLRKYAELVGVPAGDVLAAYERAEEPAQRVELHPMKPEEPVRGDLRLWPIVVVLLVLTGVIVWWLLRPSQPALLEPPPASDAAGVEAEGDAVDEPVEPEPEPALQPGMLRLPPAPASTETEGADDPADPGGTPPAEPADSAAVPANSAVQGSAQVDSANEESAVAVPAVVPVPRPETQPPAAGGLAVEFAFSADSWIDVRDANGTRLAYELGRSGTTRSVRGEPPLTVFLGYADGVDVRVEGTPWQVPARVRRGNTARFTLEGS
jgi:cytoskeleton protein RodZ